MTTTPRLAVLALLAGVMAARAESVQVAFLTPSGVYIAHRQIAAGPVTPVTALEALLRGPTDTERALGTFSAIPAGTQVAGWSDKGGQVVVDFSAEAAAGLDETVLEGIFRQVNWTLRPFGLDRDLVIRAAGRPLSAYLAKVPAIVPRPRLEAAQAAAGGALGGHSITLSPGHGFMWNGSAWTTQRPVYCSPLLEEDYHNLEICLFLKYYLEQDGMLVKMVRCADQSYGTHYTGKQWWQMAGYLWLQEAGYPCSVYASDSGECRTGWGATELQDEVRSRPLSSNLDNTDIYISVHTNGKSGDCTGSGCGTGTETYYDAGTEHADWGPASQVLANRVSDSMIGTVVAQVDNTWICNGTCVRNSNGAYGEIRIPARPAILAELGFHDTCDRDADIYHLRDDFFRSAMMWAVYKGVCDYFGTTPTWDFYSCEYVADTLPAIMQPGETRTATITLRNRGVYWKSARNFLLGAVGDSDPFTAQTRVNLPLNTPPGQAVTFSISLTAPATPGLYQTDWQMVRTGYTWFGPTVGRTIQVGYPPTAVLSDNFNGYADQAALEAAWTDTGNSEYVLDPAAGNGGGGIRMPSPSATGLGRYVRNLPATCAGSDAEPLVFQYDLYLPADGNPSWSTARHYCELRGYSDGGYGAGPLVNLVAMGLYDSSADGWSASRFQGRVLGPAGQWYTLDQAPGALRAAGWHQLKAEIKTSTVGFYVDGVLAESVPRTMAGGFNCVVLGSDLTAGGYPVIVDNVQVALNSQPPIILAQPAPVAACPGGTATFTVQSSAQGLAFRWRKDGGPLADGPRVSGSATAKITLSGIQPADAGSYDCVVTNSAGSATSNAAGLSLRPPTLFTRNPDPVVTAAGGAAAFSITATGDASMTYQWRCNGVNLLNTDKISGATTPSLAITDVRANNAGTYVCAATMACGTTLSAPATLTLTSQTGDFDGDGDVDLQDFGYLQGCLTGVSVPVTDPACFDARLDQDTDVDQDDLGYFRNCLSGPSVPATPACAGGAG